MNAKFHWHYIFVWSIALTDNPATYLQTSSPKGNDRSPDNKKEFSNNSQVSKRFFKLVKGS